MNALLIIFAIVAVPITLVVLIWGVVTARRIYHPRGVMPLGEGLPLPARGALHVEEPMLVGTREIRENQQRVRRAQAHIRYDYHPRFSRGVPDAWIESLWDRRN